MNGTDGLDALRRANPRLQSGFTRMATDLTRAIDPRRAEVDPSPRGGPQLPRSWRQRPAFGIPAAASLVAAVVAAVLAVGSPTGAPAVSPAAAIEQAATVSGRAAEQSGTVSIEVTRDGDLWAAKLAIVWAPAAPSGQSAAVAECSNDGPSTPESATLNRRSGTRWVVKRSE
jgi:hypothetical protein